MPPAPRSPRRPPRGARPRAARSRAGAEAGQRGDAQLLARERLRLLARGRRERQCERRPPGRVQRRAAERGVRRGVRPQVGDGACAVAAREPEATARLEEHRAAPGRREVRVDGERLQDVAEVVERRALQQRIHCEPEADGRVERRACAQADLDARPRRRLSRLQGPGARVEPSAEPHEDERAGDLTGVVAERVDDRSRADVLVDQRERPDVRCRPGPGGAPVQGGPVVALALEDRAHVVEILAARRLDGCQEDGERRAPQLVPAASPRRRCRSRSKSATSRGSCARMVARSISRASARSGSRSPSADSARDAVPTPSRQ